MNDLKVGSYVSFDDDYNMFFKVLKVDFNEGIVEFYEYELDYNYIKNITKIINLDIDK